MLRIDFLLMYVPPFRVSINRINTQLYKKPNLLDAIKLPHGEPVMLKRVNKQHSNEVEITTLLSSPSLAKDSRNHCVPVYDVFGVPDDDNLRILVLPLLRKYDDPPFDTVGEVVDCLRQVLEVSHGQIHVYD